MKLCKCGRPATHFIMRLTLDGEQNGKQLACDAFPDAQWSRRPVGRMSALVHGLGNCQLGYFARQEMTHDS
jgi:hypothetical protein